MSHPIVFDRALLAQRRRRALVLRARGLAPGTDFLVERVADDLTERLATLTRRFEVAVDLAAPTPLIRATLAASGKVGTLISAASLAADPIDPPDIVCDEEALPFAHESIDLIVSTLALQFVNDLPGALIQIRRTLRPDGLFLGALAGGETLKELRDAFTRAEDEVRGGVSPRVAPFADVRDMGGLLQRAGFTLPVTDVDTITVRYSSVMTLLTDLRAMGATNILTDRSRTPLSPRLIARMAELYHELHADPDGKVRATFQIISVSGWAPAATQPKPLRPGSARTRLADALGTTEFRSDDPATP
jgi:SAM-dependent methyltransferase